MTERERRLKRVTEAAADVGWNRGSITRWRRAGPLTDWRIRDVCYVDMDELEELLTAVKVSGRLRVPVADAMPMAARSKRLAQAVSDAPSPEMGKPSALGDVEGLPYDLPGSGVSDKATATDPIEDLRSALTADFVNVSQALTARARHGRDSPDPRRHVRRRRFGANRRLRQFDT